MEICPKGITIWHLSVQIKVHKGNIRAKGETSDTYSEPSRTSKMELNKPLARFAKINVLDVRLGSEYTSG